MKCRKCQYENPEVANFCVKCGGKLEILCPECDFSNEPDFKFCAKCGHNLTFSPESLPKPSPKELSFDEKLDKIQRYLPKGLTEKILSQRNKIEGERKQVTVMFCDMEGFTGLSEKIDPEEVYSIMDQIYEILIHKVHDYEGTVNEMTGDGIIALFGAPVALEDAPQRAIRSSLAIHREMARLSDRIRQEREGLPPLKMRIGIHTGPVVIGSLGGDLRVEFKAVGDTVNLASRVEGLADPGATYVTEDTFKLTEGFFRFEALGEKRIKGKEKAVEVYRPIAPSTRRTRFDVSAERGLTPFVGREREFELLLDGYERAKGGRGQAFSIVAEAGIGKSRLLYEFRKAVANENALFLEGRCLSYSGAVAYHPVVDILKANFDIRYDDGDIEIGDKVKMGMKILEIDVASNLPYILELFSVKDSGIEDIPISPEARKSRMIEVVKLITLRGSEIRPLITAYEDLHWADKSSEEVLKYILDSIPGARVLMIFTYRPEFVHTWGGKSYHNQVNLNRLSNRESLSMMNNLLNTEDIDSNLEELILEKTEGVPFFIEEFTRSLNDLEIVEKKDNTCRLVKDIQDVTIPSTVQDIIMARVDSLPEGAKSLLQTASVVGREFMYDLIKRVTGLAEQELLAQLSVLKESELLYERGIYPQSIYIFKHALTQDVAYDSLLLKKKKEIHEKIGEAIEVLSSDRLEEHYELLSYHYMHSVKTDKALDYLELANQKAIVIPAMEEAKAYFDDTMELLDTLPETEENRQRRISLLVNQATVFDQLFKHLEYFDLLTRYDSMARSLGSSVLVGAFNARLGYCEWASGNFDKAIQRLTKAAELCEASGNAEEAGYAYAWLEWGHLYRGNYDRVFAVKKDILRLMEKRFNLRWYVRGLTGASRACICLGRWDEAIEEAQKALKVAEEYLDSGLIVFATWTIAMAYTWKGDLNRAILYAEQASQQASTPADKAWAGRGLGWALCRADKTDKGVELLASLLPGVKSSGHIPSMIPTFCFMGAGYWLAGEEEKAKITLEEGLEINERCGARYYIGWTHRLLGEINLKTNTAKSADHFEKSIVVLREIKAENELALAYAGYGRLHKQKGQIVEARKYLTKALEVFERLGTLVEPEKVREILAELPEA
jgi:class 3 adenylate cyclase/tetratricopeptide (TPR) repeat protein